jgi:hypothetical protein
MLSSETAIIKLTVPSWTRNSTLNYTYTVAKDTSIGEHVSISGCAISAIELNSSGNDPVKMNVTFAPSGEFKQNPSSATNKLAFPYYIKALQMLTDKFIPYKSIAYTSGTFLPVSEMTFKMDSIAEVAKGAPLTDGIDDLSGRYPMELTWKEMIPTGTLKTAKNMQTLAIVDSVKKGCTGDILLRYMTAGCVDTGSPTKMFLIYLPNAAMTWSTDATTITFDWDAGRFTPPSTSVAGVNNPTASFQTQFTYYTI